MLNASVNNHDKNSLTLAINKVISNIRLYPLFLWVYIIGGTAAIILSYIEGLNREQIGFAFLMGSVLTLVISRLIKPQNEESAGASRNYFFKTSVIVLLFVFIFSLIPLLQSFKMYSLSLPYFIFICVMSSIITIQIMMTQELSKLQILTILTEILLLAAYLSVSFIFLFPAVTTSGNDAYYHVGYISSILSSGHLENFDYAFKYYNYPVFQLTMVNIMSLANVDIKTAQAILALFQLFTIVFIYLICDAVHFNQKISLLAMLMIALSSNIIATTYSLDPSNYSVIYYIFVLFIIFYMSNKNPYKLPIMLATLLVINLTHPIASYIVAFTLTILYGLSWICGSKGIVDIRYVVASIVLMFIQYARPIPGDEPLSSMILAQLTSISHGFGSVMQATLSPLYSWIDILLYDMGFALLMLLGISGALLILKMSEYKFGVNNFKDRRVLFSSVALILTPIPYVLTLIIPNSLPDRWFIFITVFLGLFSAVTIYLYSQLIKRYAFLVIIVMQCVIFFSITAPISNQNSQIYSETLSPRYSNTVSEMKAIDFFKNMVDVTAISANSVFVRPINISLFTYDHFLDPSNITYKNQVLIVRNYDMERGFDIPLYGKQGLLLKTVHPTDNFTAYLDHIDKFYENGEVRAFQS